MAKRKQRRDEFQDISSYSSKQAYKKNQKKKKRTGLKVFLSFICVILVLVGGVMIYASTVLLGDLKTTTITKDKTELGISEETKSEAGITNIALFGVDARDYDGGTFAGRSDAIMVMSIDNVHHKVKLTSIMRDVRVYMGDGSPYDSGYDKLNHAYMYGGPEQAIRTINQNFGLDIQDYVTVNFASMAKIVDESGVNTILVGDSLGNTILGYEDTISVTVDDMIHHSAAVARGAKNALVITDMPFMSYQTSVYDAVVNAGRIMKEGRAGAVKLEGGQDMCPQISAIVKASIPVCAHLGLTPQSIIAFGGFKVQGKTEAAAK